MTTRTATARAPSAALGALGWWTPGDSSPLVGDDAVRSALRRLDRPVYVVDLGGRLAVADDGMATLGDAERPSDDALRLIGYVPPLTPASLGDPTFKAVHGVRLAYVAGAMANGIATEQLVAVMARAGMIGFFGAAGLEPSRIEAAIDRIQSEVGDLPYGFNLIYSPHEPRLEAATVDLYLRRGVRCVSASAYIRLTLPLIRYRLTGIHRTADGKVVAPNCVMAKVSRVEVARRFFSPAPEEMVRELVQSGELTEQQAEMAASIPLAEDLTAEADSGGHTDNRPALALLPSMLALRDELQAHFGYDSQPRVGLAGGIATPSSTAAAFALGAAYVLTGSINQACVEAGTSDAVRKMLAEAGQADVTMAPAADMFEMGVNVQVLKRGTMFALRARKLYELYRAHERLEDLPAAQRAMLERDLFRCTLDEAWAGTRAFFAQRDPAQIERAEREPKHKLALVFRSYLGQSSTWANSGVADRAMDYQVWCGPAMGAFNEWARGSLLEAPERRDAVTVALNLMVGAAALTRANQLRGQGVSLPAAAMRFEPQDRESLRTMSGDADVEN